MKSINIAYWITTVLFAGLMIFTAIPNVTLHPDSVTFFAKIGYPKYIIPFLGFAKIAGSICLFIPGMKRLKEWAYAGLMFDLLGAIYSFIALGYDVKEWALMFVFVGLGFASYFLSHKRSAVQQPAVA